ncbi:MAG TPA: hypothetical protein VER04_21600 [Polyangiaceae bacterium]|nr:hypothetical protein [Polyangiaceae bacterium]
MRFRSSRPRFQESLIFPGIRTWYGSATGVLIQGPLALLEGLRGPSLWAALLSNMTSCFG